MKSYGTLVGELPTGIEFVLEGALLRIYFDFERREALFKRPVRKMWWLKTSMSVKMWMLKGNMIMTAL